MGGSYLNSRVASIPLQKSRYILWRILRHSNHIGIADRYCNVFQTVRDVSCTAQKLLPDASKSCAPPFNLSKLFLELLLVSPHIRDFWISVGYFALEMYSLVPFCGSIKALLTSCVEYESVVPYCLIVSA